VNSLPQPVWYVRLARLFLDVVEKSTDILYSIPNCKT